MTTKLDWKGSKDRFFIRIKSAYKCLSRRHFILICMKPCEDGDTFYKISHVGCEPGVGSVKLHTAAEIMEEIAAQNANLHETEKVLRGES